MLLPTFRQAKGRGARIVDVASAPPDSEEFKSLVNSGADLLLQRGDWPGTVVPGRFIVRDGCIVWGRAIQRVRQINRCHTPLHVLGLWYDYLDTGAYGRHCGELFFSEMGQWSYRHFGSLISEGRTATYGEIPTANPQLIQAYCQSPNDVGKTIKLLGMDGNGMPLTYIGKDGQNYPGTVITLAAPFGISLVTVSRIDAVIKEVTQMSVPVYAYDTVLKTQTGIGFYGPGETNPSYAKDRLFARGHQCCQNPFTVIALVKLAFVPVDADEDYIPIPSLNALKKAVQSIKCGEANDIQGQEGFITSAVNELNHVLENEEPLEQVAVAESFTVNRRRLY